MIGDIFVTATGDMNVIDIEDFERMKDGAILANSGHFDVEINVKGLEAMASGKNEIRPNLTQFVVIPAKAGIQSGSRLGGRDDKSGGKSLYLLAEGRLVNLAAAEGHPAAVMDMSFAGQAKAAEYIAKNHRKLKKQVYALPEEIDNEIAGLKLSAMGIKIDELTEEQKEYLAGWETGT